MRASPDEVRPNGGALATLLAGAAVTAALGLAAWALERSATAGERISALESSDAHVAAQLSRIENKLDALAEQTRR